MAVSPTSQDPTSYLERKILQELLLNQDSTTMAGGVCDYLIFWRRLLRVPWTARRSNQSILKEISPEYSLEGLMMKLKLQYFGHLMWRTDSFEKTLMLGEIDGRRRGQLKMRDDWMASLTQWTWVWINSRSWRWTGRPGVLQSMGLQRVGHNWVIELNWTDIFVHVFFSVTRL